MGQWPESPSNARKLYKCVSTQLYPLCLNVPYKWANGAISPKCVQSLQYQLKCTFLSL